MIGPIEKNVPLPSATKRSLLMQRLAELEIGDSFVTDRAYATVHSYADRCGIQVTTKQSHTTPGYIRVWRIEATKKGRK